jgi:rubredoxin
MSEEKTASIQFGEDEEQPVSTDINPQEIEDNPAEYARKVASQKASEYDQMAGFSVPRDFVMLPSKGRIYPPDSPLHNLEEIEVRHLTAADEDILTSRALLRSGKAIDTMLSNVLLNKSININDFISGDKNAILTFLRITGYGPDYDVEVDCPECNETIKHQFDLTKLTMRFLDVDPISAGQNRFEFILPSGIRIEFKLLNSAEDQKIADEQEKLKRTTNSPLEKNVTTKYKHQIISVDGKEDQTFINNFVDTMNLRDSRAFRTYLEEVEPDVDMKQDFKCRMCGHSEEVEIPVTVGFFWPES